MKSIILAMRQQLLGASDNLTAAKPCMHASAFEIMFVSTNVNVQNNIGRANSKSNNVLDVSKVLPLPIGGFFQEFVLLEQA